MDSDISKNLPDNLSLKRKNNQRLMDCLSFKHYKKNKFFIKDFFSKCDQIRRKLWIWSHLLKKSLMENFNFCAVKDRNISERRQCVKENKICFNCLSKSHIVKNRKSIFIQSSTKNL